MWKLVRKVKITKFERGLVYREREFAGVLGPGEHRFVDPWNKVRVEIESVTKPWMQNGRVEEIALSGLLGPEAMVARIQDRERGLVFYDDRFAAVLAPGTHVFWTVAYKVRVEAVSIAEPRLEHEALPTIIRAAQALAFLDVFNVEEGHVGLLYKDGRQVGVLPPGVHVYWKGSAKMAVRVVDVREMIVDVPGQEIMTADRVTLRLNANIAYRVADPARAVTRVADHAQTLYREVQYALRAVVGTRDLDALLADKDVLSGDLVGIVRPRVESMGLELVTIGIRDIILPGEMKNLLNKVVEAKKAAEASLIMRREETASIRSQANTAKIYETNPTLLRLRELETLEKIAEKTNLNVVLGDGKLAERVAKLI